MLLFALALKTLSVQSPATDCTSHLRPEVWGSSSKTHQTINRALFGFSVGAALNTNGVDDRLGTQSTSGYCQKRVSQGSLSRSGGQTKPEVDAPKCDECDQSVSAVRLEIR